MKGETEKANRAHPANIITHQVIDTLLKIKLSQRLDKMASRGEILKRSTKNSSTAKQGNNQLDRTTLIQKLLDAPHTEKKTRQSRPKRLLTAQCSKHVP